MSLASCIPGLVERGEWTAEQAAEYGGLFDELRQDFRRQFGDQAADAMATDATLKAMAAQAARKRFLAAQTIRTQQQILLNMRGYGQPAGAPPGGGGAGGGGGPINPAAGPAFLGAGSGATYSNVEGRWRAIRGRAHAMVDKILADHSANLLGTVRNRAELDDIAREAFGQSTGNPMAAQLAQAWKAASEMLRRRFNAAGGNIGQLADWGLPQSHDSRQVRAAGWQEWRDFILPRLDPSRMIDRTTGRPFSPQALELVLRDVFEDIRSEGWASRNAGGPGKGALANRRGDARFLVFRNADDWMAYADRFGSGNPFDAMMSHIDGMSRDVAMLEILGPNPAHTVEWLKETILKSAEADVAPNSKAVDRARPQLAEIDRMWRELTGENRRPESRTLALAFSSLRSWQTAAKLGSATLSAVTDLAFQMSARKFNGLPAARTLVGYVKLLRPGSIEDRKLAVRLGLIAEEWAGRTAAQSRYLSEELTGEVSRRLAEGVLRVSGLSAWTQAGRWAFGMEFLGHVTDQSVKTFAALDPAFQRALQRYGIGPADWDAIRATPLTMERGVPWLKPQDVADERLGDRLLEMILTETDYAVPVPDLRTRATLNSAAPRGTWIGEIARSMLLFKSFGVSVMMMQGRRIMEQTGPNGARYAAGLVIGTTLMGGLATLLKDVAAGRDPRDLADVPFVDDDTGELELSPGFWGQALAQGGGFGIFGDFIRSAESRIGGGIPGLVAGPIAQDLQNLYDTATASNPQGKALKTVKSLLPGGSLWYARLAFDRMIADQLQEAIDPEYRKAWRRMDQYAAEQGSGFWWAPGETAPERAPDLENIAGDAAAQGSLLQ